MCSLSSSSEKVNAEEHEVHFCHTNGSFFPKSYIGVIWTCDITIGKLRECLEKYFVKDPETERWVWQGKPIAAFIKFSDPSRESGYIFKQSVISVPESTLKMPKAKL